MTLKTKTLALYQKAVSVLSAPFSLRDVDGYRAGAGNALVQQQTGQRVNVDTALQLSVVFACTRIIAETVATLPLILYKKKTGARKGRVVATEHPLYELLHDSPNADDIAVDFWEWVIINMALRGRAFVYTPRDANGDVIEMRLLSFDRMGTPRVLPSGAKVYPYSHPTRGLVEYTEQEVWEIRGFGGMSVIQFGARSMGAAMNAEQAGAKLYSNDMRPTSVIYRDEFLTKGQRAQAKEAIEDGIFTSTLGGASRLIEGGMKYQQLSLSPEDAQLLESRQFSVEDLCRWFGMNPSMIGHGTAVSNWGTGREQINLAFLQYVLRAYTKRIEQGIRKRLVRTEERRKVYAEYSVEGLLRADSAGRAAFYSIMVQNGIMTRNEVRDLENLDAMDGGDELTIQSNLVPATMLGKGTTPALSAIDTLKNLLGIEDKEHES